MTNDFSETLHYACDDNGQLVWAKGKEINGTPDRMHEQFGYAYDPAGNIQTCTHNALIRSSLLAEEN